MAYAERADYVENDGFTHDAAAWVCCLPSLNRLTYIHSPLAPLSLFDASCTPTGSVKISRAGSLTCFMCVPENFFHISDVDSKMKVEKLVQEMAVRRVPLLLHTIIVWL